jgi:hypothetical protein
MYFVPGSGPLQARVSICNILYETVLVEARPIEPFASPVVVQLRFPLFEFSNETATTTLLLALLGTFLNLFMPSGTKKPSEIRLAHQPGTIASVVSIGARTYIADVFLHNMSPPAPGRGGSRGRNCRVMVSETARKVGPFDRELSRNRNSL